MGNWTRPGTDKLQKMADLLGVLQHFEFYWIFFPAHWVWRLEMLLALEGDIAILFSLLSILELLTLQFTIISSHAIILQ